MKQTLLLPMVVDDHVFLASVGWYLILTLVLGGVFMINIGLDGTADEN